MAAKKKRNRCRTGQTNRIGSHSARLRAVFRPHTRKDTSPPYGRSAGQTLVVIRLPGGPGEPATGRGLPHIG